MGDTVNVTTEEQIEIMIKRLHSGTYIDRVRKSISILELKERIAFLTGVMSGLQHLIFRGRVLRDDHFLSDYHVESGHTLYLVVRPPFPRLSLSASSNAASDPILSRVDSQRRQRSPVIPDALTIVSVYLNLMRRNNSQTCPNSMGNEQDSVPSREIRIPSPSRLPWLLQNRRQLLIGEVAECLSNISMLLVDPSSQRLRQGRAVQSEILLSNLGNSLIQLGRATSRIGMGERPVLSVSHRLLLQIPRSRLQTNIGARNLPRGTTTAPRNAVIRRQRRLTFLWPSPRRQQHLAASGFGSLSLAVVMGVSLSFHGMIVVVEMGDTDDASEALLHRYDLIEINIKEFHSGTYTFSVERTIPIQALKLNIEHRSLIMSKHQRLLFRGRVLNDDLRLSDYQVEEGHTVYLVVKPSEAGPVMRSQMFSLGVENLGFVVVQCNHNSDLGPVIPNYIRIFARRLTRDFAAHGDNTNNLSPAEMAQRTMQLFSDEVAELSSSLGRLLVDRVNGTGPSARRRQQGRLVVESGLLWESFGRSLLALGRAISETPEEAALSTTSPTGQNRLQSAAHDSRPQTSIGAGNQPLASDPRNGERRTRRRLLSPPSSSQEHVEIASSVSQNEVNTSSPRLTTDEQLSDSEREMVNTVTSLNIHSKERRLGFCL